jgi:cell division control protein 6
MKVERKIEKQIDQLLNHTIILNRRYLDDEQLNREEQFEVLKEIFDVNVRSTEIKEISAHFAPVFRNDHPSHLSLLGKTGTGKTVTVFYILNFLKTICSKKKIDFRYEHLDLTTPKPCFRALNDLACILDASKRYKKGISLDELMCKIEDKLKDYKGYLVLFIDEVDHVRTEIDTFLKFLVRRLPQKISAKLILVFVSNKLNWIDNIDPRIKSFLKLTEIVFTPYNACDLRNILSIRIKNAISNKMIEKGVVEKIAAISSRDHGDARKAVELLAKSAHLSEKNGVKIDLNIVDEAVHEIEKDRYLEMIKNSPTQLQASLYSVIEKTKAEKALSTGLLYESYTDICKRFHIRVLTQRAFFDLLAELDIYGFVTMRVISKGRYGRSREVLLSVPENIIPRLKEAIHMNFERG